MNLVDPEPSRRLELGCGFQLMDVVLKDVAHGLFVNAGLLGCRGKDALQTLQADPCDEAMRHPSAVSEGR